MQTLLTAGADPNANPMTPLHIAAVRKDGATPAIIEALLIAGVDVMVRNDYGLTPLHYAAGAGTLSTLKALLAAGADVNARNDWGITPLHEAATSGTVEILQALLDADAYVMAHDNAGWTPLHNAAHSAFPNISDISKKVQKLLSAGADATAKSKDGKTPWNLAQDNKYFKGTIGYWALEDAQTN